MKYRKVAFVLVLALCLLPLSACMLAKDMIFQETDAEGVDVSLEPIVFALTDIRYPEPRVAYVTSDNVRLFARNAPPSDTPVPPSPTPGEDGEETPEDSAETQTVPPVPFVEFEEIETLARGEILYLLGQDAEEAYLVARTQRNTAGYVRAGAVEDFEPETMIQIAYTPDPGVNQPSLALLDTVVTGIVIDPLLSQEDNYLSLLEDPDAKKHPAYLPHEWLLLDVKAARKLVTARDILAGQGLTLKVVGGYYPQSLQYTLFHAVNNETLVPNPAQISRNAQGLAVDVVLVGADGQELSFPTPVYTYTEAAAPPYTQAGETQRQNVETLRRAMEEAGFTAAPENWWQFYDADSAYMICNMQVDSMILKAAPRD